MQDAAGIEWEPSNGTRLLTAALISKLVGRRSIENLSALSAALTTGGIGNACPPVERP
jgi:hypothetical protein